MPSIATLPLRAVALACRIAAWALALLTVLNAFVVTGLRAWLLPANGLASDLIPGAVSGLFVFQTPLGGAFRGDFLIAAVALLALDWFLTRLAASLR